MKYVELPQVLGSLISVYTESESLGFARWNAKINLVSELIVNHIWYFLALINITVSSAS